jgi:hypothetical protein
MQTYVALNERDIEAFIPCFDEKYESWDGTIKGLEPWKKWITEYLDNQTDAQFNFLGEIGIVFVTSDVAIYKDHHEVVDMVDADGNRLPKLKRIWASVWAKRNGKWLMTTQFVRRIEE